MLIDLLGSLLLPISSTAVPVLRLFGDPIVTVGQTRLDIPDGSKRLLAFVALHRARVTRQHAAGTLWPVCDEIRASGNLRSALWRLNRAGITVLYADKHSLAVREDVVVDVDLVCCWAGRLITGKAAPSDLAAMPWGVDGLELLPGWYEDWALMERERVRQRLLHAVEVQSRQLVRIGRCAEAVEAAMVAVKTDPLRESAQRALIEAHLAEGNWVEGLRAYEVYRDLMHRELAIDPDPQLGAMIEQHRTARGRRVVDSHLQLA